MNKIIAYGVRPDEAEWVHQFAETSHADIKVVPHRLTLESLEEARGYTALSALATSQISRDLLRRMSELGIRYLAMRSAGYDNVDLPAAAEYGIRVSHAMYSPNSVAEYTVMLMLMCSRRMKQIMRRNQALDFTLPGNCGREVRNLTIGIVGTGRIGCTVAKNLSGFAPKLLAYDQYQNPALKGLVDYVDWETLLEQCDVITLHAPATANSHHLINREAIARMKPGMTIINCGRGELIDTDALLDGLETGHIGSAALDVLEGEVGVIHRAFPTKPMMHRNWAVLEQMPNVILTPHTAFYTDQAVKDMVQFALQSLVSYLETGSSEWEVPFDFDRYMAVTA